jgi:hypothetical protein
MSAPKTLFEIPLIWGVVRALVAPQLEALGAIAALISKASAVVERVDETEVGGNKSGSE